MISAFGVDHGTVAKRHWTRKQKEALVAGSVVGVAGAEAATHVPWRRLVRKSQLPNGEYKPANKLTPLQRQGVRAAATGGRVSRPHDIKDPGGRGFEDVYAGHGYVDRTPGGFSWTSPQREMAEKSKPSKVHPNVHYGRSMTKLVGSRDMDKLIDPKVAAGLKHPVVFHHDPMATIAGALPPHATTGGTGHIQVNHEAFSSHARAKGTINHELAHAQPAKRNPVMTRARTERVRTGEEARADAVSGANMHTRFGNYMGKETTKQLIAAYPALPSNQLKARTRRSAHYHAVRAKVASAVKRVRKL